MLCPRHLEEFAAVDQFLVIVNNICRSECYSEEVLSTIYRAFFAGRLHHFIHAVAIRSLSEVIVTYIMEKRPEIEDELAACALKIVRMGKETLRKVDWGHLRILCSYLMVKEAITEN